MPSGPGSGRRWCWLAVGALLVPTLVLFWEIIFAGRVLFWGAPLMQFGPWYRVAADAVRSGEWPLWNPLVGNGAPLLANYQTALFYPPNWLHLVVSPAHSMSWLMVLHVVWAGLGMWLYTGQIRLRPLPRLVSALSFMFSGYLVSRLGFPSIGSAFPWLPWLLWAAERLVVRPAVSQAVVLGLCLGLQWLSGHAQTSFYGGLGLAAYLTWRAAFPVGERSHRGGKSRLVAWVAVAGAIGIGLAAVQLLPTLELQRLSQRAAGVETGSGMTYSLWPWRLVSFVSPRFFGHPATGNYWGYCCNYWEDNGYVGLLPLLLAGAAVCGWIGSKTLDRRPRSGIPGVANSLIPFFAVLSLSAVVLAFGIHTPVYPFVFEHVPVFDQFQAPARLLCLWTLGVSVLAGIGAETWRPTSKVRKAARYGIVTGLALVIAAGVLSQILTGKPRTFTAGLAQLGVSLALAGVLALHQPDQTDDRGTFRWSAMLLLFIAADLVSAGWGANPTAEGWLYTRPTESAAALRGAGLSGRTYVPAADQYAVTFDHYLSFESFGPGAADVGGRGSTDEWFGLRETMLPNMGALDGVPAANNYDPFLVGSHADLTAAVDAADPETQIRLLRMMGVETLITERARPGLPVIHSSGEVHLSAVPDPLPRAFLVYSSRSVASPQAALEAITAASFDPAQTVVLEAPPVPPLSPGLPMRPASLTDTYSSATIRASLPADGYLVLSDTFYPGWHAFVDGLPSTIYRADLAFRAVALPAGEHLVEFTYRPLSFRVGAAISGLSWILVMTLLAGRRVSLRRKSTGAPNEL